MIFYKESMLLDDYVHELEKYLKANNQEYRDISNKIERLKYKFPVIRGIFEDEKIRKLSFKESKIMLQVIELYRELFAIKNRELLMFGAKKNFEYLQDIKVI